MFERTRVYIAYPYFLVILMKGADSPTSAARTLYSFNTPADIKQFATGCDGDIGGLSTVHFDLDERPEINKSIGKTGTGMFWGDMRTQVKPGMEKKIRGGYAGFRNKVWVLRKGLLIIIIVHLYIVVEHF
jgi:NADH dehydrogenase [ubiquinone] 1 alpha subcomplex assembly factor 1